MTKQGKSVWIAAALAVLLCSWAAPSQAQVARVHLGASQIQFEPAVDHQRLVLTVSGPNGVIRREFNAGQVPAVDLSELGAEVDGSYSYELRVVPRLAPGVRQELAQARRSGDAEGVSARLQREGKLPKALVQSGSFQVESGAIVPQDQRETDLQSGTGASMVNATAADQVIPDDLIVQGSGCFGFDCVNNESFGFDTIRLKENNLRIKFEDTSTGAFPANDWQLTANDSASGGANKFSIEDITGSKVPFTVTAGAATNSIFVDSTGRVGFRTSTPVLDLHVNTSNTPAIRLEQNNSGGFTAQTWDVAGNEANFFVRDVTGGSRLPFRIRPGAPTSSIDISSTGEVGIGTASPDNALDVRCNSAGAACAKVFNSSATGFSGFEFARADGTVVANYSVDNSGNTFRLNATNSTPIVILTNSTERIRFPAPGGNIITAANGAFLSAGGTWTNASSRDYKEGIIDLDASEALATVKKLDPVKFHYKTEPSEEYIGFIAEDVPELVANQDRKSLSSMDVVAVLTKVVQEQQKTIDELSARLADLEKVKQ